MGGGSAKSVVPVAGVLLPWLVTACCEAALHGDLAGPSDPVSCFNAHGIHRLTEGYHREPKPTTEGCLPPRCRALGVGPAGSCSLARRLQERYEGSGVQKVRSRVVCPLRLLSGFCRGGGAP